MFQVLVVDDDPATRLILTRALKKQGYSVAVATNGEEGILQAQKLQPALVICDWMMPVMSGLEVCRQIKADPALSTTFFILLTSLDEIEDRVKGLDNGADEFIAKPIEMNELQARVRAGLRLHQLSRDLQAQKQLLETELAEAAEYVRSLLPPDVSQPVPISGRFIPSRQLGGDCFDYFWLDPEHLVIYLLDVSGHGLGSALPSVSVLNLLRSRSIPDLNYYQPSSVLQTLNEIFQMRNQNEKYFTIWYGVYNHVQRQLVYASAGHPPALLVENGISAQVKQLRTPGLPIGMFPEMEFVDATCQIHPEDTLYVFSDGLYEIHQPNGTLWSLDALTKLLQVPRLDPANRIDQVLEHVQQLNGSEAFEDDLSLIQISFRDCKQEAI